MALIVQAAIIDLIIYWSCLPLGNFNLFYIFLVGLLYDLLSGGILGLNALTFPLVSYFNTKNKMFENPLITQLGVVIRGLILAQAVRFVFIALWSRHIYSIFPYFLVLLFGVLLWPMLKYLLDKYRTIL